MLIILPIPNRFLVINCSNLPHMKTVQIYKDTFTCIDNYSGPYHHEKERGSDFRVMDVGLGPSRIQLSSFVLLPSIRHLALPFSLGGFKRSQ